MIKETKAEYINFAFFLIIKINKRIKTIPKGEKTKGNNFESKYVLKKKSQIILIKIDRNIVRIV